MHNDMITLHENCYKDNELHEASEMHTNVGHKT